MNKLVAVVGPTGVGKSDVAAALARRIPAEIIVVDSMQVYRGMDLGTAKSSSSIQAEIPHHGLDLVEPEQEFHVARYVELIRPAIEAIQRRGRLPILVGGSGLYLRALVDGLCKAPGVDAELRARLMSEGQERGAPWLHQRLQEVDVASAQKIHPNDLRRVIRALEVYEISRQPLSQWQQNTEPAISLEGKLIFGLTMEREKLYARVEKRIDDWLAAGWLEEARKLHQRKLSATARKALGYQELFRFLDGQVDWLTAVELIKKNTRHYAKRQWTWFRQDDRVQWVSVDDQDPQTIAQHIEEEWKKLS